MKTLKDLFGKNGNQKSIGNFSSVLDTNAMNMIKGGDQPGDDDLWPPIKELK